MPRKIGKPLYSSAVNSDSEIMGKLKMMAQEILDLQATIAVKEKIATPVSSAAQKEPESEKAPEEQHAAESTGSQVAEPDAQAQESVAGKLKELSLLRYELATELETGLTNLQQVMKQSQTLVEEMNQLLAQQQSGR